MARLLTTLLLLAATSLTTAHPTTLEREVLADRPPGCGTKPTAQFLATVQEFAAVEAEAAGNSSVVAKGRMAATTINTYFHVVARSTALSGGYIPQASLDAQIDVFNQHFADSGFTFVLAGTDYTVNTNWASDGDELAMKKALRKGTYQDLNVYFQYSVSGYLGYCYLPTTVASGSDDFYYDACSILYSTVPGGSLANYNLGGTVTHEVGHWLGLLHVFDDNGSCTSSGDGVADTPAQSVATNGCPTGQDSCPSQAGVDSVHNYMDYSYDACYEEFTTGQITRMTNMWASFRAGK